MSEEIVNETGSDPSVAESAPVETSAEFNFKDHISEDLRSHTSLADIKDMDGLVKSYVSAQTMIGGSVRIPGEDSSTEQKSEFFNKLKSVEGVVKLPDFENAEEVTAFNRQLGCPEEVSGYNLDLPEGATLDGYEHLIDAAHKAGLTNSQLKTLAGEEFKKNSESQASVDALRTQGESLINEVFGADKDARISGAKAALRVYSEKYPDQVEQLLNSGGANSPILTMMLADLGKSMQESGHQGMKGAAKYGMGPDDAQMKIDEIMSNPSHAYFDDANPGHSTAVDRMQELYKLRYSG